MRVPKLCHHKATGRGYVYVGGSEVYFRGRWPREQKTPPAEIEEQYQDFVRRLASRQADNPRGIQADPSLDELWLGYYHWARKYYVKNGKQTSEVGSIKDACQQVVKVYGSLPARDFGPLKLKEIRQAMIDRGLERNHINKQVSRIRRMFRWGVEQELLPEGVLARLQTVPDLGKGRGYKEERQLAPVTDEVFFQTASHLPGTLKELARVHRYIGCRADEICALRPCELTEAAGGLWLFKPTSSKNDASYYVGPRAQGVLAPLLSGKQPDEFVFSTRKRGAGHWTTASYRRAVTRICQKQGLPRWSPLMVRKAAGQEARDRHEKGIEATQARLDHQEISVSQLYAWKKDALAMEVAQRFG